MDKLLALRTFVETVNCGGFSAAARRLGIATSSVTRAVNALETELGSVLLNRNTRTVSVTESGRDYYQRARAILEALVEADAAVADRGEEVRGRLSVNLPVEFGRRLIAPRLAQLLERHAALELNIRLSDKIVDLLGERVDAAVRLGSSVLSEDVVSIRLGRFRHWLVASPQYLARMPSIDAPEALLGHTCLQFDYNDTPRPWRFVTAGEPLQLAVSGRLHSNNSDLLREAALAGQGVALLADWLVREDIASGRLVRLLPAHEVSPGAHDGSVNLLYLPNHRGSRRIAAFAEFLRETLDLRD